MSWANMAERMTRWNGKALNWQVAGLVTAYNQFTRYAAIVPQLYIRKELQQLHTTLLCACVSTLIAGIVKSPLGSY